jgi:thioredoxin 1
MSTTSTNQVQPQKDHVRTLTTRNFDAEVLGSPVPVLVDFSTAWCGPCKRLSPIMHKLAEEQAGKLTVGMVDGDDEAEIATRFGVRAYPTIIAFSGGKEVARHVGLTTREKILALVNRGS